MEINTPYILKRREYFTVPHLVDLGRLGNEFTLSDSGTKISVGDAFDNILVGYVYNSQKIS